MGNDKMPRKDEEIVGKLKTYLKALNWDEMEKLIRDAKSAQDMQMIIKLKKELENFTLPA